MEHLQGTLTPLVHAHVGRTQMHTPELPRRFTMGQPDDAGVICFALTLLLTLFMAKKD
jgi:hypothetical protein